jgi:arginine deiminase
MTQDITFGVHSEVGQLRKVMVCAPGRAHQRLTPSNCDDLLFDDVLWVDNAKRDHFDFMTKMRDRGVDVVEMHNLLAQTVALPEAKKWILDNQVHPNQIGLGLLNEVRSYLEGLSNRELAETLIGGLSTQEFPESIGGEQLALIRDAAGVNEYLLPPLPNTLYTRDTTCWIYGGAPRILSLGSTEVTVNGRNVAILFPFWHKLGTPFCGAEFHEHTGRSAHWPDGRMPP